MTIELDQDGRIVQSPPSLDGGDTCNRTGQMRVIVYMRNAIGIKEPAFIKQAEWNPFPPRDPRCGHSRRSLLVRHPTQIPWNNPYNCTRDQIVPVLCAWALEQNEMNLKAQLRIIVSQWGFYQSIERDYPGTRKSLFPQRVKKGQRWDDTTFIEKDGWVWKPDYADLCTFVDWGIFLRGLPRLRSWVRIPALLWSDLFLFLTVVTWCKFACRDKDQVDDMQLLCLLSLAEHRHPTFLSDFALKYYFKNRPRNNGSLWEGCTVMAAVAWYFRGEQVPERPKHDSPEWVSAWRPVVQFLKERAYGKSRKESSG